MGLFVKESFVRLLHLPSLLLLAGGGVGVGGGGGGGTSLRQTDRCQAWPTVHDSAPAGSVAKSPTVPVPRQRHSRPLDSWRFSANLRAPAFSRGRTSLAAALHHSWPDLKMRGSGGGRGARERAPVA